MPIATGGPISRATSPEIPKKSIRSGTACEHLSNWIFGQFVISEAFQEKLSLFKEEFSAIFFSSDFHGDYGISFINRVTVFSTKNRVTVYLPKSVTIFFTKINQIPKCFDFESGIPSSEQNQAFYQNLKAGCRRKNLGS